MDGVKYQCTRRFKRMVTYKKRLQQIISGYMESGRPWPATTHEIAEWAIQRGLYEPQRSDVIDRCANELSRTMREEYITDPQGRTIRAKHVAKIKRNGEIVPLWEDIRTAKWEHMQCAFQQRRQQIVGDCRQLKMDLDSYNENQNKKEPLQVIFDFTYDLEEIEIASK